MRVGLIQERLDAARGGAETSTLEIARNLVELGADMTLVAADPPQALPEAFAALAGKVHHIDVATLGRAARTRRFVELAAGFCQDQGFDIVHAITPCPGATVYQPRGGTYAEAIAASTDVGRSPLGRMLRRALRRLNARQRFLLKLEDRWMSSAAPPIVAAVSQLVRNQVLAQWRLDPDDVVVIFNGVDIEPLPPTRHRQERGNLRARIGAADSDPVVGFVAHNFRLKGLRELLMAMKLLGASNPPWRLIVAGRDNPRPFQRLARRLEIGQRVFFAGPSSCTSIFAAIDVLAHPTWYDPCSRVVLEALSCGVPVVTTKRNGAAEAIEAGRNGIVIDSPRDIDALIAGLETAVLRGDSAREMAASTRDRLSMRRHARELLSFYERILSKESGRVLERATRGRVLPGGLL